MHTSIDHPESALFARVLGDEIRKARRARGWTRKQLQAHLPTRISVQTLATYELGTRQCSAARLVELCDAMNVFAHDLLARVHERMTCHATGMLIDLDRVLRGRQPELVPLRRWARQRLDQAGLHEPHTVRLDQAALDWLAEVCGVIVADLIEGLRESQSDDVFAGRGISAGVTARAS